MELKTVIITRHQNLPQWLKNHGVVPQETEVFEKEPSIEWLNDKHVVGILPRRLEDRCGAFTYVDVVMPRDRSFVGELTLEQLDERASVLKTRVNHDELYVVVEKNDTMDGDPYLLGVTRSLPSAEELAGDHGMIHKVIEVRP